MATRHLILRNRAVFTASIEEQPLAIAPGTYIDYLSIAFKGDGAVAVVALETFLNLVQPLQFKVNGDVRVSLRGRDIFALNALVLPHIPFAIEGAVIGEDVKVSGMKVPIWYTVGPNDSVAWLATRVAVTNISGELISFSYTVKEGQQRPGYYQLVELTGTTPGTTGLFTAIAELPRVGRLMGILVFSTTVPTATADLTGVQELILYRNDRQDVRAEWWELGGDRKDHLTGIPTNPFFDTLTNYGFLDLSEDPWDLKTDRVRVEINAGVASEAFRLVPVFLAPAGAGAGAR